MVITGVLDFMNLCGNAAAGRSCLAVAAICHQVVGVITNRDNLGFREAQKDFKRIAITGKQLRLFDFLEVAFVMIVILQPVQQLLHRDSGNKDTPSPMVNHAIGNSKFVSIRHGDMSPLDVHLAGL